MPAGIRDPVTLDCPNFDQNCPRTDCPGRIHPSACEHWHRLNAWRAVSSAEQVVRAGSSARRTIDPEVRDAVLACEARGSVLPISAQDDCGCWGRELSECRAGKGGQPGKVTLQDCLDCQSSRIQAVVNFSAGATLSSHR